MQSPPSEQAPACGESEQCHYNYKYVSFHPLLTAPRPSGADPSGWFFLGEPGKFVPVSRQRFEKAEVDANGRLCVSLQRAHPETLQVGAVRYRPDGPGRQEALTPVWEKVTVGPENVTVACFSAQ